MLLMLVNQSHAAFAVQAAESKPSQPVEVGQYPYPAFAGLVCLLKKKVVWLTHEAPVPPGDAVEDGSWLQRQSIVSG